MSPVLRRFAHDQRGATLIEYTVLIGILILAVLTTILGVGNWMNTQWSTLNSLLR